MFNYIITIILYLIISAAQSINSMESVDSTIVATCHVCHQKLSNPEKLRIHLLNRHFFAQYVHICFHQNCTFTTQDWPTGLRKHHKIHSAEPIRKCRTCKISYIRKEKTMIKIVKVLVSPKPVTEKLLNEVLDEVPKMNSIKISKHCRRNATPKLQPIQCDHCSESFEDVTSLNEHRQMHKQEEELILGQTDNNESTQSSSLIDLLENEDYFLNLDE